MKFVLHNDNIIKDSWSLCLSYLNNDNIIYKCKYFKTNAVVYAGICDEYLNPNISYMYTNATNIYTYNIYVNVYNDTLFFEGSIVLLLYYYISKDITIITFFICIAIIFCLACLICIIIKYLRHYSIKKHMQKMEETSYWNMSYIKR